MRSKLVGAALLALGLALAGMSGAARAADETGPNGNWRFVLSLPDLGFGPFKLDIRLSLKEADGKLTGKIGGANGQGIVDILDGAFKDQQVSFRVSDPTGASSWYKGKLEGDKITGTFEADIPNSDTIRLDWAAARETEEK